MHLRVPATQPWLHREMLQQHSVGLPDGTVDIMLIHILPEVHHCRGLRHTQHALKMPHSHRHAMTDGCLFTQSGINLQASGRQLTSTTASEVGVSGHEAGSQQ